MNYVERRLHSQIDDAATPDHQHAIPADHAAAMRAARSRILDTQGEPVKTISHGRNARDPLLHIEADGVLVNITVGLTDTAGHHVTRVDISPDDKSRGGDGTGHYWYQDGARIIRLNPGEEPPASDIPLTQQFTSLWLLTIEHRHGVDHALYASEETAKDGVYSYVEQWWDIDGPGQHIGSETEPGPIPEDRDEAISAYFEDADDEFYSIKEVRVEGAPAPAPKPEPVDLTKAADQSNDA